MLQRRQLLALGGGGLAAASLRLPALAQPTELIEMLGTARGERVWFSPVGLAVSPGATLRFINRDPGNSHTSTAYHPELFDRPLRIPGGGRPWNSDYLLPEGSFEVTLDRRGVYDYYCLPHEMAGMVGRIVVGGPGEAGWVEPSEDPGDVPEIALAAFPSVASIMAATRVNVEDLR
jgi:plastocyanin